MRFPIEAKLKDGTRVHLVLANGRDIRPLQRLYQIIVEEGTSYPHDHPPADNELEEYWFRGKTTVAAYLRDGARPSERRSAETSRLPKRAGDMGGCDGGDRQTMLGAFYLKPNWPGRARHVANAGFIVSPQWRNNGLGWLLGACMLDYAGELGYRSVIFNLVFSENVAARHLWKKLGFTELALIPQAVKKKDGTYQHAVIMFRSLVEEKNTV
jgi:RimJ/RimL family protein N-acetyltransferase